MRPMQAEHQRKTTQGRQQQMSKSKRAKRTNEIITQDRQGGRYMQRPTRKKSFTLWNPPKEKNYYVISIGKI